MGRLAPGPVVLVVDDDVEVRRVFSRVLESGGYNSVEARTAEHAWSLLELGLTPAAVLLDLRMPGVGGLGLLTLLRADPRFISLPVTIVTGDAVIDEITESAVAALHATMTFKPLDIEEILTLTHRMMEASGHHGAS